MGEKNFLITVKDADVRFYCGENESILSAMRRAGKGPIRFGCFGGGCGVCKMRILSGAVYAAKRMSREHVTQEEERQGTVLICCVQPREDVVLTRVTE